MVLLPGTRRQTSRLGFGTSGLHGGWSYRASMRLLDVCYDAGIRHIDTAPLYGLGYAESLVGEFLARHKGQVTVTTKFGLLPPRARAVWEAARAFTKPIVSRIPGAKERLLNAVSSVASNQIRSGQRRYTATALLRSLETSLQRLRCDCIDVFLLHEADREDVSDEVRHRLDRLVAEGSIGCWGLGSNRARIDRTVGSERPIIPVLQFEWSILSDRLPHYGETFVITHGAFSGVQSKASVFRRELAHAIDRDLSEPGAWARLLACAALAANEKGIVLFTSKNQEHIREIASLGEDVANSDGKRLLALLAATRIAPGSCDLRDIARC
jgi:D-threo-aldose 1-dehydrogenase